MKMFKLAAIALAFAFGSTAANAATFGPNDWVNQDGASVAFAVTATLTDQGGGTAFALNVDGLSVVEGDIFEIGFDGAAFGLSDISGVSTNTGDTVTSVCNDCSGDFNGGLFQNAPYSMFDTIVTIGVKGSKSGLNSMIEFVIDGIAAADVSALALRVQTVTGCDGCGGSLKLLNDTPGTPTEVPLPASALLLLAGLGGLGVMRRRK